MIRLGGPRRQLPVTLQLLWRGAERLPSFRSLATGSFSRICAGLRSPKRQVACYLLALRAAGRSIRLVCGSLSANRSVRRHRIKGSIDYAITDAFKIGGDAQYYSSQYFVGDESNLFPKLPGYAVFNLSASYQIDKTFQVYPSRRPVYLTPLI